MKTKTKEELRKVVADYNSVDEVRNAITPFLGEYPQFVLSSGNYVICDKDNYAYINAVTRVVRYKLKDASDPTQGIVLDKQINLQDYNSNIQTMVGLVMTYDGGPEAPSIKMGFGSGSTPALMGFGDDEDKLVGVLSIGPILEQPTGVERFQWNTEKNSWESVWTRGDVSSTLSADLSV